MLLVLLAIFSVAAIVSLYSFCAGIMNIAIHQYLLSTSKVSEFYHDHRACVAASLLWPVALVVLGIVKAFKLLTNLYNYPKAVYLELQERRKKIK